MSTFFAAHFSQQYISVDTCVCQQLVVRPEPLPGHFTFQPHSSSQAVTFYTLHILALYSTLRRNLDFNIVSNIPWASNPGLGSCSPLLSKIWYKRPINRTTLGANLKGWRSQQAQEDQWRPLKLPDCSRMSQKQYYVVDLGIWIIWPYIYKVKDIHSHHFSEVEKWFRTILGEINFLPTLSCPISTPWLLSQQEFRSFAQQMCTEPFLHFSTPRYERVGRLSLHLRRKKSPKELICPKSGSGMSWNSWE